MSDFFFEMWHGVNYMNISTKLNVMIRKYQATRDKNEIRPYPRESVMGNEWIQRKARESDFTLSLAWSLAEHTNVFTFSVGDSYSLVYYTRSLLFVFCIFFKIPTNK